MPEDLGGRAYELGRSDYWRVSGLFEDLSYNLVVDSVIAGNTPAWVYVDDAFAPRTGWLWNRMGTILVAGNPDNRAFNRALSLLIDQAVLPEARRRQIPALTCHYSLDGWEEEVESLLPRLNAEKAWRRFYRFDRVKIAWRDEIPRGCVVRRIDSRLLRKRPLRYRDSVVGWINSFWHSIDDFLETGFGFCVLRGEAVVSWCLTVYASERDFELGLATIPEHRNQGYATLTAAACVEHCARSGLTPHWHCDEENVPSIRVAERVGFSDPERYAVFVFAL